jgi:NADH-quinone oxidoreductase subunit A
MPAGLAIVLAVGLCGLFTALAVLIGPKATNPEKLKPFECGSEPIGTPRGRYSVKFYQVAILFLVFDIESAFMYPWAALYQDLTHGGVAAAGAAVGADGEAVLVRQLSLLGFGEMVVFVAVLGLALAYVWRKRAIGWD